MRDYLSRSHVSSTSTLTPFTPSSRVIYDFALLVPSALAARPGRNETRHNARRATKESEQSNICILKCIRIRKTARLHRRSASALQSHGTSPTSQRKRATLKQKADTCTARARYSQLTQSILRTARYGELILRYGSRPCNVDNCSTMYSARCTVNSMARRDLSQERVMISHVLHPPPPIGRESSISHVSGERHPRANRQVSRTAQAARRRIPPACQIPKNAPPRFPPPIGVGNLASGGIARAAPGAEHAHALCLTTDHCTATRTITRVPTERLPSALTTRTITFT